MDAPNNPAEFQSLRSYLSCFAPLGDQEWKCLEELLYIQKFKRKESFQAVGKPCQTVGFIVQGCFRWVWSHDEKDRTFDFAVEHELVTNYYSILTQQPSEVDILAVEPSVMVCMNAARLLRLFDSSFTWQKIGRHLAERAACYSMERLVAAFYGTPHTRYEQLMQTSPELFLRIPHHIIANYLGMTKETLSRLRKPAR